MSNRILAGLCIALAIGAGIWFLQREPSSIARSGAEPPLTAHAQEVVPGSEVVAPAPPEPSREPLAQAAPSEQPARDRDAAADANVDEENDRVVVEGTIIVTDADGKEHRAESGTVSFIAWKEDRGSPPQAALVESGRFRTSVEPGTKLAVRSVELGGRVARVADDERLPIDTGSLEIRARWPRTMVLRVIDARSRADILGVQVVRAEGWETQDHDHPGEFDKRRVLRDRALSPFEVQPRDDSGTRWQETLYARAPGYAWTRFEVDFAVGGQQLVELHPAAELEVTLMNYRPDAGVSGAELEALVDEKMKRFADAPADRFPDGKKPSFEEARQQVRERLLAEPRDDRPRPVLRVRAASEEPLPDLATAMKQIADAPESAFEGGKRPTEDEVRAMLAKAVGRFELHGDVKAEVHPSRSGPTRVADLLPGKYVVTVEIGNSWDDPVVLGHAVVELRAGEKATVTLTLEDPPSAGTPVPLEGTLYVPPAWTDASPSISFEILGRPDLESERGIRARFSEMQPVAGSPGLYRWTAGLVAPGRYEATLHDFELSQIIEVPDEGQRDARIVIGEPADLRVHLVDAQSGSEAKVDAVHWYCERPAEVSGGGLESAKYDADVHAYQLRAPAGKIVVHVWQREYQFVERTVELQRGPNEVTITLERACGVRVSLREGVEGVAWPDKGFLHIESIAGDGHEASSGSDQEVAHVAVSKPGRYRVTVPQVHGYEPVPPFEIDIPAATFVEHTVTLQRRR